jgi:putative FmdB family regulatory protein
MPIYEFICKECKQPFEKLVRSASLIPTVTCPNCGSHDVQKELSIFATKSSGASNSAFSASASSCAPGGT